MKIAISYFYKIRFFDKNMIPLSTGITDPAYYHNFTYDYNYTFYDKRGILNGLRANRIINCGRKADKCDGKECTQNPNECNFLKTYRQNLEEINLDEWLQELEKFEIFYKNLHNIKDEIIFVLIVYETPSNPCSERQSLLDFFHSHNIECKELFYGRKITL